MIHLGIDHHKKYSHVVAMNDSGAICWDGQLDSTREAFRLLKESLPADEPVQCVLEAGRNWGIHPSLLPLLSHFYQNSLADLLCAGRA